METIKKIKMNSKNKKIFDFQYNLLQQIKNEVLEITGEKPKTLKDYEESFLKSFPLNANKEYNVGQLTKEIDSSQVVLIGDFHSQLESQLNFLTFVKNHVERHPECPIIIALECFSDKHQKFINQYLNNEINEKQLFTQSNFNNYWGFPWQPILSILDYAKESGLKVAGINSTLTRSPKSPRRKDKLFAKNIAKLRHDLPDYKIFVLVGEHHLGTEHLPQELKKIDSKSRYLNILSHCDELYLYFLAASSSKLSSGIVQLQEDHFLLLSSPPWGKWASYLLYLEHFINQPGCISCQKPWDKRVNFCSFEDEEIASFCLEKYFAHKGLEEDHHPHLVWPISMSASMDGPLAYLKDEIKKPWNSFLDKKSEHLFWKSLSWKGTVHGIIEILEYNSSLPHKQSKRQKIIDPKEISFLFSPFSKPDL